VEDISRGFHMRAIHVDGSRFTDMYNVLRPLVAEMRAGGGPRLVEAHVVRLDSHSSSDDQSKYRSQEELEAIVKEDPLAHTGGVRHKKGVLEGGEHPRAEGGDRGGDRPGGGGGGPPRGPGPGAGGPALGVGRGAARLDRAPRPRSRGL